MVTAGEWLERAERLRLELARLNSAQIDGVVDEPTAREAQERFVIAKWLRSEFSDEPPEDTRTMLLFPGSAAR